MTGTLHADRRILMTVSRAILLRMRNVSDKICRENQNTFHVQYFLFSRALSDNVEKSVQPDRPQVTIWRMCIACWISKATGTHIEYVVLIAFPLQ